MKKFGEEATFHIRGKCQNIKRSRALQAAMQSAKLVNKVTVDNRAGAGGTIGLACFVNTHKGDPNALLVGGMVMVGAIETHKSPVKLSQVTPVARLTGEYEVVVVPAMLPRESVPWDCRFPKAYSNSSDMEPSTH